MRLVGGIWLMVVITSVALMLWLYSDQVRTTEKRARQQAENVHQMTMPSITAMMLTGTMSQRDLYLDQIRNVQDINDLRVLPSKSVMAMFGTASGATASPAEQQVLDSGAAFFTKTANEKP
jgi:methyl-accepting chemotaxis protein